jgi:hypothetical protein
MFWHVLCPLVHCVHPEHVVDAAPQLVPAPHKLLSIICCPLHVNPTLHKLYGSVPDAVL